MRVFCLSTPFLCPGLPQCNVPAPVVCPGPSWQTWPFFSMPSLWQKAAMSGSGQLNGLQSFCIQKHPKHHTERRCPSCFPHSNLREKGFTLVPRVPRGKFSDLSIYRRIGRNLEDKMEPLLGWRKRTAGYQ